MSDIPDLPPVLERLLQAGYHEQIGAYALDSLPADERIAFEVHLRDCAECQTELPILISAALALRRAIVPEQNSIPVDEPTPPTTRSPEPVVEAEADAELPKAAVEIDPGTETVLAGEEKDEDGPQLPSDDVEPESAEPAVAETEPDDRAAGSEAGAATTSDKPTSPDPLKSALFDDLPAADPEAELLIAAAAAAEPSAETRTRRRRPQGRISPGAAPTASELAVVTPSKPSRLPWILGGLGLLFGIVSIIAALALAESKNNLEEEIAFQNTQIEELNAQRDEYLQQTTAITWELQPTTLGTPGSGGAVFADPAGLSALITVFGMSPLGNDQTYQVWYVRQDDSSAPGPILTLDSNGGSVAQLTPDLSVYKAVAVTVEPAEGSELPSTNPVLQSFFAAS